MSNGHYTALVDANRIMHWALESIAQDVANSPQVAQLALHQADEISNRNGITQSNEETNNVTK